MSGDLADILARLRIVLPKGWFAENSPNLKGILVSIATPWTWLFGLITYVIQQTRLSTATEDWLDLIALDFFGADLSRRSNESDLAFRNRIKAAILREAASRGAVSDGLQELVGTQPAIFEPANCGDAGFYGSLPVGQSNGPARTAYGLAGGWGSLQYPSQFFITVARPATPGLGMLAGYSTSSGGYGAGATSYVDIVSLPGHISDEDIQDTLHSLLPVNTVAWLRII